MLTDEHGNPLKSEAESKKEDQPQNGHNQGRQDVRTIPTGTLIYNLGRIAGREDGCMGLIQQFEMMKAQQKMLQDPQPLALAREELAMLQQNRYIIATEINERFRDLDMAIAARRGIEIFEPGELADEPPQEN